MKNILLAVTGLTPEVITEFPFALHQTNLRVAAIRAITTGEGKEMIFAKLLKGTSGHYHRYLEEYGIAASSIEFGYPAQHPIRHQDG